MSGVEPEKPERRGSQRETIKCGTCSRTYKSTTKIILVHWLRGFPCA